MKLTEANLTEEVIHNAIEEIAADSSEEQKEEYKNVIKQIFHKDIPIAEALKIKPEVFEAMYAHAYRLYNSGNYQSACLLFAYLVTLDPGVAKYHMGQAASHHMLKEYGPAVDSYMTAFFIDMTNPLPFFHVADCLLKEKSIEGAYFCLGMAAGIAGENPKYDKIRDRAQMMQSTLRDPSMDQSSKNETVEL